MYSSEELTRHLRWFKYVHGCFICFAIASLVFHYLSYRNVRSPSFILCTGLLCLTEGCMIHTHRKIKTSQKKRMEEEREGEGLVEYVSAYNKYGPQSREALAVLAKYQDIPNFEHGCTTLIRNLDRFSKTLAPLS